MRFRQSARPTGFERLVQSPLARAGPGLLLVTMAACSGTPSRPGDARGDSTEAARPLVILISIDTLRADHVGCYGYRRPTTPFLDALASRGVVFEQAISAAPWTLPAHATLLTGVHPGVHRAVEANTGIAPGIATAAELVTRAGIPAAGVVASWFVSRHYGFARGFSEFEDFGQTADGNARKAVRADQVVDRALIWLAGRAAPAFLFLHFYDPHFNYDPPPAIAALFDTGYRGPREPYRRYSHYLEHPLPPDLLAQEMALYDAEIRTVDEALRRLHGALDRQGLLPRTLFVVTADHGEEFFEHGSWGHAHTLYDEQIRVPLIISGAGVPGRRQVSGQVRHVDVLPTVLESLGVPAPPGAQGRSLWPRLRGEEQDGAEGWPAYVESSRFDTNQIALRRDGWKLIHDLAGDRISLFNLASDPGERQDLARSETGTGQRLRGELQTAAAAFLADRWMLRWVAEQEPPLEGRLTTDGHILAARVREGTGEVRVNPGNGGLDYRLEPGAVLELALLPLDAALTLVPPRAGSAGARVVLGRESRPAPPGPLIATAAAADRFSGLPTPLGPAAALWVEQGRGGSGQGVALSEDDIRRLESLGYVMR